MEFIKNFRIISEKLSYFREKDIKLVTGINYYIDYNENGDEVSFLEVAYILEPIKVNGDRYKLLLKFNEVTSLNITNFGGAFNQMIGFKITDMKDRNWESSHRYYVHDYENDTMNFYCKSISALLFEKL
ncbi:hypothetical protein [Paenibacillus wenxiniae]|uniref:Immunity protein 50 n=1 Tax=Paenibacillus wenxiniae TaxID=1636843 RepID=A0ABW4RL59_9BACL